MTDLERRVRIWTAAAGVFVAALTILGVLGYGITAFVASYDILSGSEGTVEPDTVGVSYDQRTGITCYFYGESLVCYQLDGETKEDDDQEPGEEDEDDSVPEDEWYRRVRNVHRTHSTEV